MCDAYLLRYYKERIIEILKDIDERKHFSLDINFSKLSGNDPDLGNTFLTDPEKSIEAWDNALCNVQTQLIQQSEENYIFKKNVHSRIYSLPLYPECHRTKFPKHDDINKFLQVSGTVARISAVKILEYGRQYICSKCKYVISVSAQYEFKNLIKPPKKCTNPEECKSKIIVCLGELDPEFCKDYQEIKIQEAVGNLDAGSTPKSMWVTLENDLVDSCKPGDNVTICGLVKTRENELVVGKLMDIELVLQANHIQINNSTLTLSMSPEHKVMFESFWKTYIDNSLAARDMILKSICPEIFGMYMVKLAVAVVLAGGSNFHSSSDTGTRIRSEPHLLLVGDPGTGKSQLLRFASKIIPRSVLTTGVGSTAAGLTVTVIMENGEWQLEGGALVMSDGGICCIDEFNTMKEHDRMSIHEAMEQQTISVAKAGIVCKLSTRCSILAATNPKGNLDTSQPLSMNVALPSPLLSRFDLILLLKDKVDEEWDSLLADYILNSFDVCNSSKWNDGINWTIKTLQAYFAVIKKIHPVLTDDSKEILSSYYQCLRKKNVRNKASTTVRLLDSLVRLSQGHARLMYHEEVTVMDAVMAVILVETSMDVSSSVFNLDFNLRADFPHDPLHNYTELADTVLKKLQLEDLLKKKFKPKGKPSEPAGPSRNREYKTVEVDEKANSSQKQEEDPVQKRERIRQGLEQNSQEYGTNHKMEVNSPVQEGNSVHKKETIRQKREEIIQTQVPEPSVKFKSPPIPGTFKSFFNKFRLIPKENQTAAEPVPPEKQNVFENDGIGDISFSNVQTSTQNIIPKENQTVEKQNIFEHENDDIGDISFSNVQSTTQNSNIVMHENSKTENIPKKRFHFKKVISPEKNTVPTVNKQENLEDLLARKENIKANAQTSMFETQEELDDLNFDL